VNIFLLKFERKVMSHLDIELQQLKSETIEMWTLVNAQLVKGKDSLVKLDKDLAREVIITEKRVNANEIKLDRDCENIFALFTPVAVDLRFVLAVLKINSNLERTGDIAEGIAKFVLHVDEKFDRSLLEITRVIEMYEAAIIMMDEILIAFENEDTSKARKVFQLDELLDEINLKANTVIELIFFIEAKVLKHRSRKEKEKSN
jgi:phosphate transport system protein